MAVTAARAAFVLNEWRYQIAEDTSVKTKFPNAREVVLETQLAQAAATTLAAAYLAETDSLAMVYEVDIEDVIHLEDLSNLARYYCTFPGHVDDGRIYRLISAEVDYLANRSKLRVRG
ncbi:MAG: hypothetical protein ACSLE1_15695 [Sphingobium sp.]